jgi:hypothetical protein
MSKTRNAAGIVRDAEALVRTLRSDMMACACLSLVLGTSAACTKTREQPQLAQTAAPVSNSLRAPTYDPSAKQGKVKLPSRQWGSKTNVPGSMGRPLTNANKEILEAQGKSLNEDANGLKRGELQKALDEKMGGLSKCFDNTDVTSVGIYFEADPSGEARGIRVRGAPAEAESCARGVIGSLHFPEFQGNPVPIDFPVSISRRTQTIKTTVPGAADQAPK